MHDLAAYTITQQHIAHWTDLLVADAAPYFVPDDLLPSIAAEIPVFSRQADVQQQLTLAFCDSYTTYAVDQTCQHVVFLTDDALRNINPHIRTHILHAQWRYGRGQVYAWEWITEFFAHNTTTEHIHDFVVDTPAGQMCVLGATLWRALPADQQERWLRRCIIEKLHPYPTLARSQVELPLLRNLPLASLANSFAFTSGPNCFATTLAAITDTAAVAQTVSLLWLDHDAFLNGIRARGYVHNHTIDILDTTLSDAVVTWSNDAGTPQHACWLIGEGIALNKNGQSWFLPRHLAALWDVLAYWEEDNLHVQVHTRA